MMIGRRRILRQATASGSYLSRGHGGVGMCFRGFVTVLRNGGAYLVALALGLSQRRMA